jgi:hypothetical protein
LRNHRAKTVARRLEQALIIEPVRHRDTLGVGHIRSLAEQIEPESGKVVLVCWP